jgi:hypothetical protein
LRACFPTSTAGNARRRPHLSHDAGMAEALNYKERT